MDIATTADIKTLVDQFYEKVRRDALLAPIFNEIAQVDWPSHVETLYTFWETLLFGSGTYQGAPFPKHSILPVEKAHFDRWLELFLATVDENFSGPKAEEAKGRALSIADTFCSAHGRAPAADDLASALIQALEPPTFPDPHARRLTAPAIPPLRRSPASCRRARVADRS